MTGYFWITSDISPTAVAGNNIDVATNPTLTFAAGTPAGTISAGGLQTIVSEPVIAISSPNQIPDGNIIQNTTNNVIYSFQNDVTVSDATITGLTITTSGTYASTDLINLKAWYSADNTFDAGTDVVLSTKTTSLGQGTHLFPGWTNQTISSGSTGYIFITAEVPCATTGGNTIVVNAVLPTEIAFLAGSASGSTSAGGTQTIELLTPADATALAASVLEASSVISWTAPAGCYSQVMIVVKDGSSVTATPSGDGSAYTANLAFGIGTGFDGGYVVYKGTTSPQTVTGINQRYYVLYKDLHQEWYNMEPGNRNNGYSGCAVTDQ
ncbi:MAG: hypothetical protein IPJ37_02930 [Bacteroidales bacterium]|nr:hypothetical protein [Bacteroidales bacterium]